MPVDNAVIERSPDPGRGGTRFISGLHLSWILLAAFTLRLFGSAWLFRRPKTPDDPPRVVAGEPGLKKEALVGVHNFKVVSNVA